MVIGGDRRRKAIFIAKKYQKSLFSSEPPPPLKGARPLFIARSLESPFLEINARINYLSRETMAAITIQPLLFYRGRFRHLFLRTTESVSRKRNLVGIRSMGGETVALVGIIARDEDWRDFSRQLGNKGCEKGWDRRGWKLELKI